MGSRASFSCQRYNRCIHLADVLPWTLAQQSSVFDARGWVSAAASCVSAATQKLDQSKRLDDASIAASSVENARARRLTTVCIRAHRHNRYIAFLVRC
jgi:hypothetical protein